MPAYADRKLKQAIANLSMWTIAVIKRPDAAKRFQLLPPRCVVERTAAWLNRIRRLAEDFEATLERAHASLLIAGVTLVPRRIAGG